MSEKFEITMNAGLKRGPFTKKIAVTTSDRENQSLQIECVANVKAAFKIEPVADTVNFGSVRRSFPAQSQTLTITRGDGGPIKPELVSTGNPQVSAEIKELEPGEKYELVVGIAPPWPNGMLRSIMSFKTGIEEVPSQTLSVYANVTPRLQATPARLTVRTNEDEETEVTTRLFWDGDPGQVLEATVSDPNMKVSLRQDGDAQLVALVVPAGFKTAARGNIGNVTLKTDDATVPTLQIPIALLSPPAAPPTPAAPAAGRPLPPGSTVNAPPSGSAATPSAAGNAVMTGTHAPGPRPAPTTQPAGGTP